MVDAMALFSVQRNAAALRSHLLFDDEWWCSPFALYFCVWSTSKSAVYIRICCHQLLCILIVIYCVYFSSRFMWLITGDDVEVMLLCFAKRLLPLFVLKRLSMDRVPLFQSCIASVAVFNVFILSLSSLIVSAETLSPLIWHFLHFVIITVWSSTKILKQCSVHRGKVKEHFFLAEIHA